MAQPKKASKSTKLFTCECGRTRLLWRCEPTPKKCNRCSGRVNGKRIFPIHNRGRTTYHNAWLAINQCCYNKNHQRYDICGAANIKVCDEWQGENGFINFYKDMGEKPTSRKRIILGRLDYSEDFTPENCKWMSMTEANSYGRLNR